MSTQTLDQTTDRGLIGGSPQWSTVRATGTWQGDLTAALFARDFEFRSSEPESYGGKNDAPNPMELLLGAVNGCITVVVEVVAEELGIEITSIDTDTTGRLDQRGFAGVPDVSPAFQEIVVKVVVGTDADDATFAELQRRTASRSPALALLVQTEVDVREEWLRA